jgi:hypothetical protein
MAQIRKGDRVRAFLDANVCGIVESINYENTGAGLMVGGVPPVVAMAIVKLDDGRLRNVRTTELYVEEAKRSR